MRIRILKTGISEGANSLKQKFQEMGHNTKYLRPNSPYTDADLNILWGYIPLSERPHVSPDLNNYTSVSVAGNKLKTFQLLLQKGDIQHIVPEYTTNFEQAVGWLNEGYKIYFRKSLIASRGKGIVVVHQVSDNRYHLEYPTGEDEFPEGLQNVTVGIEALPLVPLYVKDIGIKHEYRAHVVTKEDTREVLLLRKARINTEQPHSLVRNHQNYHFVHKFTMTQSLRNYIEAVALRVVEAMGLNFGAVDLAVNTQGELKVLEVNTKPGISAPSTVEWYVDSMIKTVN